MYWTVTINRKKVSIGKKKEPKNQNLFQHVNENVEIQKLNFSKSKRKRADNEINIPDMKKTKTNNQNLQTKTDETLINIKINKNSVCLTYSLNTHKM
jgi:hypothetical protein